MSEHTVLLVDDDAVFVEAMKSVLATRYNVLSAGSGEEAIVVMSKQLPDLVLLDVMMTYPSEGYDFATKLKTDPRTATIPVIMLTGVDKMFEIRSKMEKSWIECDSFVAKPPDFNSLMATIDALITGRRSSHHPPG